MCGPCQGVISWFVIGALIGAPVQAAPVQVVDDPRAPETPQSVGFGEAETLYVEGRVLEAISAYQRLFLRTGEPVCLANIGRLYEERGDFELAADHYLKFMLHPRASEIQKSQVRERLLAIAPDTQLPITLPRATPRPPPERKEGPSPPPRLVSDAGPARPSRLLPASGGVLMAVGVPGVVVGGLLLAQARTLNDRLAGVSYDSAELRTSAQQEAERKQGAAIGLLVCGGLGLVAGLTAVIIGGRRVSQAERKRRIGVESSGVAVRF